MCQAEGVLDDTTIGRLRDDLAAAEFTLDAVTTRLGPAGLAALARNQTIAAVDALGRSDDPQATLIRLWVLGRAVSSADARAALSTLPALERAGLVRARPGGQLEATVELKPYGWGDATGWVCSDRTPMDGRVLPPRDDHVLGPSPASTTLAQLTVRRPVQRALDLGTGSGVQSLHLADHAGQIVATDVNPRALALARITLGLSGAHADLRHGSLYEPVTDESFDLIVTNPPYVMAPPKDSHLTYREGVFESDGLMRAIVAGAPDHLRPGGLLHVVGNWAITPGEPWPERLASWIAPTGCDAIVCCRETLDVYEYIEIWLADAGLTGQPEYSAAYRRWLDYFAAQGIVGVGMGWLSLRRADRLEPEIRIEDWPHGVVQPVGAAFGAFFDAVDTARADDSSLLASRLVVADDVV